MFLMCGGLLSYNFSVYYSSKFIHEDALVCKYSFSLLQMLGVLCRVVDFLSKLQPQKLSNDKS